MPHPEFWIEPLDTQRHHRADFSSGSRWLDDYLKQHAGQEVQKRVSAVFILTPDGRTIAGYYTLSQHSVDRTDLPEELMRKLRLPKYADVPCTLLGRLARSLDFSGRKLGDPLVLDAFDRSLKHSAAVASTAIVVDPIDDHARAFYLRHGFIALGSVSSRLILPMATVAKILKR